MYKVFVNDNPLIISGKYTDAIGYAHLESREVHSLQALQSIYQEFAAQPDHPGLVLYNNENTKALFDDFRSLFLNLEAAGGLVRNSRDEWLFIYRFGHWDLPKGKIENNESPDQAALREVTEETGISGQRITATLPDTYHTYVFRNHQVLKRSFWYAMFYEGEETLKPQREEKIERAVWFSKETIVKIIPESYASLTPIINETLKSTADH